MATQGRGIMSADRASPSLRRRRRGQALTEFALVVPVLIAIVGGIVQFGMVFWGQVTLTQVVRDAGRWEATQQTPACHGDSAALVSRTAALVAQADQIATDASLFGYDGQWADSPLPPGEGLEVSWHDATPGDQTDDVCPPPDNQQIWNVTISAQHTIPVFLPGLQFLPGFDNNQVTLSSSAVYRIEPRPVP